MSAAPAVRPDSTYHAAGGKGTGSQPGCPAVGANGPKFQQQAVGMHMPMMPPWMPMMMPPWMFGKWGRVAPAARWSAGARAPDRSQRSPSHDAALQSAGMMAGKPGAPLPSMPMPMPMPGMIGGQARQPASHQGAVKSGKQAAAPPPAAASAASGEDAAEDDLPLPPDEEVVVEPEELEVFEKVAALEREKQHTKQVCPLQLHPACSILQQDCI